MASTRPRRSSSRWASRLPGPPLPLQRCNGSSRTGRAGRGDSSSHGGARCVQWLARSRQVSSEHSSPPQTSLRPGRVLSMQDLDGDLKQYRLLGDLLMEGGALLELSTAGAWGAASWSRNIAGHSTHEQSRPCAAALPQAFLPLACAANLAKNLAAVAMSATRAPIYRSFAQNNNMADITARVKHARTPLTFVVAFWARRWSAIKAHASVSSRLVRPRRRGSLSRTSLTWQGQPSAWRCLARGCPRRGCSPCSVRGTWSLRARRSMPWSCPTTTRAALPWRAGDGVIMLPCRMCTSNLPSAKETSSPVHHQPRPALAGSS